MKNYIVSFLFFVLLSSSLMIPVYGDFLITKTIFLKDEIEFDGIWTTSDEWKPTSLTKINTENGSIYYRYAHQEDFIYFFIDVVSDSIPERNSDKAMLCFDTKNDKSLLPQEDDFCFISILGKKSGHIIQGGSNISSQNYFTKIKNHPDYIAIGNISTENDPYSKIPHPSYEFRIPTDLIGRSNIYGLYVGIFDNHQLKTISWPESNTHYTKIPNPSTWGHLISPDNSLPEFNIPLFFFLISLVSILIISKIRTGFLRL